MTWAKRIGLTLAAPVLALITAMIIATLILLATGEETLDRVDLVIPGVPGQPDTDFRITRRYRSKVHYDGPVWPIVLAVGFLAGFSGFFVGQQYGTDHYTISTICENAP